MTSTFEDIIAWQHARSFVKHVYLTTKEFPDEERFGLVSQFRRAAVSIAANIAEGYKRIGRDDKLRFFNYSQGSLEECRCYIILSNDLGYITEDEKDKMIQEIEDSSRLLNSYSQAVANRKQWEL